LKEDVASGVQALKSSKRKPVALLWVLEIILILVFAYSFAVGGTVWLMRAITLKSLAGVLALLVQLVVSCIIGLPAYFVGKYLLSQNSLAVEKTQDFKSLLVHLFKQPVPQKTTIIGRLNIFSNAVWEKFPAISSIVLTFMVMHLANMAWILYANSLYHNPSIRSTGDGAFVVGLMFSIIEIAILAVTHAFLVVAGIIAFILDSKNLAKKNSTTKHSPVFNSNFNPLWLLLVLGLVPTLYVYSYITKPIWEPIVFYATASPTQKLEKDLSKQRTDHVLEYIRQGANVNAKGWHGQTALIAAIENGEYQLVIELMKAGVDLNLLDMDGRSALDHAMSSTSSILTSGSERERKINNQRLIAKVLIDKGVKLYTVSPKGCHSALNIAVFNYDWELVNLLLRAGAPADGFPAAPECSESPTPLMQALQRGKVSEGEKLKMLKILLEHGALVNRKAASTPLHLAVGKESMVEYLIDRGADINATNEYGFTPIMLAAENKGMRPVVDLLLQKGAKLDTLTPNGSTPISAAAISPNNSREPGIKIDVRLKVA